jgi:acetylornithine deacetylase/succinyl-diaminopimelate desuccinylase-like protein
MRPAPAETLNAPQQLAKDIFKELIEINTASETGDTGRAADAMAARLRAAGFGARDFDVFKPAPHKGNLVARLRGTGARKPILLLAHLDVVPANPADWSLDPFKLTEMEGYFYGRGTSDDKNMAAAFTANFIRYKKESYKPDRDIILALTADEEIGGGWGVQWLLKNHRNLIDAEFALNEGNALPQTARATVNCRILPGESVEDVRTALVHALGDDQISVSHRNEPTTSPPSVLDENLRGAIEKTAAEFWPGTPVTPTMTAGSTDGRHLRNAGIPTYGHSGLASAEERAHGKDERVLVKSFFESTEYLYRLIKRLAAAK